MTKTTGKLVWTRFGKLAVGEGFSCLNERGMWHGYVKTEITGAGHFASNAKRWETEGRAPPSWARMGVFKDTDRVIVRR
jgi:hypothetical protein